MAKYCPEKQGYALYLDCKECEERTCEKSDRASKLYFIIYHRKKWRVHSVSTDKMHLEEIKHNFDLSVQHLNLRNPSRIVEEDEIQNINALGWENDVLIKSK